MKPTRPHIPAHLSQTQARQLIERIDALLEYLLALHEGVQRAYFPDDPDVNPHGWTDHIPF